MHGSRFVLETKGADSCMKQAVAGAQAGLDHRCERALPSFWRWVFRLGSLMRDAEGMPCSPISTVTRPGSAGMNRRQEPGQSKGLLTRGTLGQGSCSGWVGLDAVVRVPRQHPQTDPMEIDRLFVQEVAAVCVWVPLRGLQADHPQRRESYLSARGNPLTRSTLAL